ncbi:hypothetical protein HZS_5334 [Henneguya salminicola]|uniref:L-dopachrome isomerase n=1 Tax=Henneguya salminicola TaxID=69463 RepID=A0A6G3MKF1_HENSL|nr:hypothetical protein HZS_5334 [Henneguya salminicola]
MPILSIRTSVDCNSIPTDLTEKLTDLICEVTGKPKSYVCICICDCKNMTFGRTSDPCAFIKLKCLEVLPDRLKTTAKVMTLLTNELKIPGNRMYMQYECIYFDSLAFDGTTFSGRS